MELPPIDTSFEVTGYDEETHTIEVQGDLPTVQMIDDLCHGRRKWMMSIPAQPDYDPDLVIAVALQKARNYIQRQENYT